MKRFFNTDLHISVVADLQNVFGNLGHVIDDWCMSGHHWVLGKKRRASAVINWNNWQQLDGPMCDAFYEAHCVELGGYDGFVVTHCPAFALLYERWQKPVIVVVSTRCDLGFQRGGEQYGWIQSSLRRMYDAGQVILVSNNRYDAWHCSEFLGLPNPLSVVESLCEYTEMCWSPARSEFLLDKGRLRECLVPAAATLLADRDWRAICSYRGIIHSPYNVSTMSYFEQYSAGIPLMFPSQLLLGSDNRFLTELGTPIGDLGLADFFNWPAIAYFDSYGELQDRLTGLDVFAMHSTMMEHNQLRRRQVYNEWSLLLSRV